MWSLIFLWFGVNMANTEEQRSQVQQRMSEKDFYQTPQVDVPWRKKMPDWRSCDVEKVDGNLL